MDMDIEMNMNKIRVLRVEYELILINIYNSKYLIIY
jgi:hypothetical protein